MKNINRLFVYYNDRKVGTMALYKGHLAAFAYDAEWLSDGFSVSPFSLPLENRVFMPKYDPFDGIFGVFSDSLPDGWGRLLIDRLLTRNHMNPREIGNLTRLSIIGNTGMGALSYEPDFQVSGTDIHENYDYIASECRKILEEKEPDDLDALFRLGGSSGGARPKILTQIDGEDWIIKFPAGHDPESIGRQEYEYSLCAKACGIELPRTHLFASKHCSGYFGVRRFDRENVSGGVKKIHMISVSGLLETSHRIPNLDYDILMRLTLELTKDFSEVEKLYRLMCFNVFAHNRDDHSKNFSYLYLDDAQRWVLSPAYDLTYSSSLGGEHATMVHGNGRNPGKEDLLAVASGIGISRRKASAIADEIRECTSEMLREYLR